MIKFFLKPNNKQYQGLYIKMDFIHSYNYKITETSFFAARDQRLFIKTAMVGNRSFLMAILLKKRTQLRISSMR
jgi:hypothetical protein